MKYSDLRTIGLLPLDSGDLSVCPNSPRPAWGTLGKPCDLHEPRSQKRGALKRAPFWHCELVQNVMLGNMCSLPAMMSEMWRNSIYIAPSE